MPPLPEVGCPIFLKIQNPWGKVIDNDPDKNGKPSDHKIVLMSPINTINNKPARTIKEIKFRPITEAGLQKMQEWFEVEGLDKETHGKNVHEYANLPMASVLLSASVERCFVSRMRNFLL